MDFRIWFIGFIAHITIAGAGERAVFVKSDVAHRPVLVANPLDVQPSTTFPYTVGTHGECRFDLTDHTLEIMVDEGHTGPVTRQPSFVNHVPPLSLLTDGKPISKVKAKIPLKHKRVLGYLDYQGGCLSAAEVNEKYDVTFVDPDWPDPHHLAVIVQYSVQASADVKLWSRTTGQVIVLSQNATAVILNLPPPNDRHSFADYNWILDGNNIAKMRIADGTDLIDIPSECLLPSGNDRHYHPRTPDLECTNSRYP